MNALQTTAVTSRLRALIDGCVFLLLAACFIHIWLIDGLVLPCRIVGGSMAETLLGVHRDVVCDDCGCRFVCGSDVVPVATRAICPNCGYAANDLQSPSDINGDRVLIDRSAFSVRSPRRWEVIAFRQSGEADNILVKRVVGLPDESIEIRNGDVYADGHIQRKGLAQQRALAVLVHDANFRPTHEPTPPFRWQVETRGNRWIRDGNRFLHTIAPEAELPSPNCDGRREVDGGQGMGNAHTEASVTEPVDWLAYHHWRRLAVAGNVQPSPITDISSYNPGQTRREEDVHAVTDLMLSFQLGPVSGRGSFVLRASDGPNEFKARLQFDADRPRYQIFCNGQPIVDGEEVRLESLASGPRLIEVSLVDQQFLLAIDGVTIVTWPYDRPDASPPPSPCPLAIGVHGLDVAVSDLRVYRDVYYTHPIGAPRSLPTVRIARLAECEYYVLGDNSPASTDSRAWPDHGAVDGKLLVGKPLAAISSVPFAQGSQWHFQVPNLAEIRYIR